MKVRHKRNPNLYIKYQQQGGFPVFRGRPRRGGWFLGNALKSFGTFAVRKLIPKVVKPLGTKLLKSVAPKLARAAVKGTRDVVSGKMSLKQALKEGVRQNKKAVMSATSAAIKEELANFRKRKQKGGRMMYVQKMKKGITKRKKR